MPTSSVCDPSCPAALSPLICRPNGVTIFGAASVTLGALSGALLFKQGKGATFGGVVGLLAAGALVAASSPEVTQWVKKTKGDVQNKVSNMREERAARKAAQAAAVPVPVAVPVPTGGVVSNGRPDSSQFQA